MGRRIALVIGNTEYNDPYYKKLTTPGKNAVDLKQVLEDPQRCAFEVIPLLNTSKTEAERQILNLFKDKSQDDFLLLYFAGHGLKDSDGALYFAMKDTERDAIEVTAISASFVKSRIDKSFSERIVVILDCCFSGAFGETMSGLGELVDIKQEFEGNGYGRVILTATDAMQYAWDRHTNEVIGNAANSVFTHYIVEGVITGEADRNSDGEITVDELFSYVYEQTVKTFPKQTPKRIVYHADNALVLAYNPKINRLSSELLSLLTHSSHYFRLAAINQLEELLYLYEGQNPTLIEEIVSSLNRLANDHNGSVSRQASTVIEEFQNRSLSSLPVQEIRPIRLFLSSPSDVHQENILVHNVVQKLNEDEFISNIANIVIVDSDDSESGLTNVTNGTKKTMHERSLLPSQCDIVVVVFWTHMGTPLLDDVLKDDGTRYESEIEWEYEDAIKAAKKNNKGPYVLVYRSNRPIIRPDEVNLAEKIAQFQKVERFFSKLDIHSGALKGGYTFYETIKQFESILERHLRVILRRVATGSQGNWLIGLESYSNDKEENTESINVEEIVAPYLNWVIEQHSQLELRGLGGDAKLPTIPLEKVYVALKGSRSTRYEREQSRELLHSEVSEMIEELSGEFSAMELASLVYFAERRTIVTNPNMPTLAERDRPDRTASVSQTKMSDLTNLGEAFRKERWMI